MSCLSFGWLESVLIWCVVIAAVWAIISLLLPLIKAGPLQWVVDLLIQILTIVVYAIIVIFVIYIAFDMISCLISMGGGLSLPHHR
jgi:hypothetical protein